MSIDAAEVLDRQAGREYSFGSYKEKPAHASQLHLLSKDNLADLSTNLGAEHFLVFGRKPPVAFAGKGIRNDVTLFQSKILQNAPRKNYSIVKLLSGMEMKYRTIALFHSKVKVTLYNAWW